MKLRARVFMTRSTMIGDRGMMQFMIPARYKRELLSFVRWRQDQVHAKGEDVELDLVVEEAKTDRTMDQNALMWSLYEIEADVMNGGMLGPGAVTKDDLYDQDMDEHAPTVTVVVAANQVGHVRRLTRIKEARMLEDGRLEADIMITSSKWDVMRMARHIDMQFDRLADAGVPMAEGADVKHYWQRWRQYLNDRKIVLHDDPMTEEEYRERQSSCEACGTYIGDGSGILAHISTRGSGVTWGPEKEIPSDWLHLCTGCELVRGDSIHLGGWTRFLEGARHLRFKIMRALKREVQEVEL